MRAVVVVLWKGQTRRVERRFSSWRAYERFLQGLARGRWRRVYRSGAYLEASRPGLYLEVLGWEEEGGEFS